MFFYKQISSKIKDSEYMIFPLFLWIIISFVSAMYLTGAHFFILIAIAGTISLAINVFTKKSNPSLTLLLFVPVILLFAPTFEQLPVALGLKFIPFSGLLLVLMLAPFVNSLQIPNNFPILQKILFICLALVFVLTELTASISDKRPNPDSLYYFQDNDLQEAYWLSYDSRPDDWNKDFFQKNKLTNKELSEFNKKYKRSFKISAKTDYKNFSQPQVQLISKRDFSNKSIYQFKIKYLGDILFFDLINNNDITLLGLKVNKHNVNLEKIKPFKKNSRLLRLYTRNQAQFTFTIEVKPTDKLDFDLITLKPDLLENKAFDIPPRPKEYIAKPFIYSDSIISKSHIIL